MKVSVVDTQGKQAGSVSFPDEIVTSKAHPLLLARSVKGYLANRRRAKAKAKTRGMVSGSGRKIWRQKGTGRARHGDRYAPLFVGGGVAHGPTGEQAYKQELPRKMRRKALFTAITQKLRSKELMVVAGLEQLGPKTKGIARSLGKVTRGQTRKLTLIVADSEVNVRRAARNLKNIRVLGATNLNTYLVVDSGMLVFTKEAVTAFAQTLLEKERQPARMTLKEVRKASRRVQPRPVAFPRHRRTKGTK